MHKKSNRIPPPMPKCVKKCHNGYITACVTQPNGEQVRFKFKKLRKSYIVLKMPVDGASAINMCNDIHVSPMMHKHFSNLITLKSAIAAVESWLGFPLPDINGFTLSDINK